MEKQILLDILKNNESKATEINKYLQAIPGQILEIVNDVYKDEIDKQIITQQEIKDIVNDILHYFIPS